MSEKVPQTGNEQLDQVMIDLELQNAAVRSGSGYENPELSVHERNEKYDSYRNTKKELDKVSNMDVSLSHDHVSGARFSEYRDDGVRTKLTVDVQDAAELYGIEYRTQKPELQYDIGLDHVHKKVPGEKHKAVRYSAVDDEPTVGVYRQKRVNPKTGYVEVPVVHELTGARAEKAKEVLKRRAARHIINATMKREAVINDKASKRVA